MAKKKLKPYQQQLLDLLVESDWELIEIDDGCYYDFYEHWTIRSMRQKWGYEVVINFAWCGYGYWNHYITATTCRPSDEAEPLEFARTDIGRGRFNEAVTALVEMINEHRSSVPWPSDDAD